MALHLETALQRKLSYKLTVIMSSASETEIDEKDSENGPPTPKKIRLARGDAKLKKQKHRIQKYRAEWEQDPQCSPWLGPDPASNTKAKCKWCNISLIADISLIKIHKQTKKHIKKAAAYACTSSDAMSKYLKPQAMCNTLDSKITNAEIKICSFLAAHNIPYAAVNDLIPCMKSALPDSKILEGICMKRQKATKIVTNVIGASHKEEIANHLKKQKFSILTDDSTDCSSVKTACIVVRFYNVDRGRITSMFWELSSIFPEDDAKAAQEGASGRHLYNLIIKSFEEKNIPLTNILGFGCDGAGVNIGARNSIASRLKESCPGIIIMRCICHSLHLAASKACEQHIPRNCEDLARNVHNYVQHSAKRIASLAVFQKFLNVPVHKILHPAQTRWLSLLSVVDRMLEQWEPLRLYFMERHMEERTLTAESIFTWLRDPFVKLYYHFLSWVLPKVVTMNTFFQSESVVITSLAEKMEVSFKELLTTYMTQKYVATTPLSKVNTENKTEFIPLENIYLGVQVLEELKKPEVLTRPDLVRDFRTRCRNFLMKLCKGIQERFDFDDPLLSMVPLLHPSKAMSKTERNKHQSLFEFWSIVPRAKPENLQALQRLGDEWRRLPLDEIPEDVVKEKEPDIFWHKIAQLTDSEGSKKYTELPSFALAVLCTPHANADCERVFSKYNLVKTKSRNRLTVQNIEGAMLASQAVKLNSKCCAGFEPTKIMHSRMTSAILYDALNKPTDAEENNRTINDLDVIFEEI